MTGEESGTAVLPDGHDVILPPQLGMLYTKINAASNTYQGSLSLVNAATASLPNAQERKEDKGQRTVVR